MALSRLFTFGPESKPDASEPVDALAERMQDFVFTSDKQPPRPALLRLPPELRIMILEYILIKRLPSSKAQTSKFPIVILPPVAKSTRRDLGQPAVLRVCSQLRAEGLPIFYGENTFVVTLRGSTELESPQLISADAFLARWLTAIGEQGCSRLKKMMVMRPRKLPLKTPEAFIEQLVSHGIRGVSLGAVLMERDVHSNKADRKQICT